MGAKKFDTSLETRKIKLFGRDIPGFCRDIPELPEKFEKKVCVQFPFPVNRDSFLRPNLNHRFGVSKPECAKMLGLRSRSAIQSANRKTPAIKLKHSKLRACWGLKRDSIHKSRNFKVRVVDPEVLQSGFGVNFFHLVRRNSGN